MLFNYTSGLKENFNSSGAHMPGQTTKNGWKLALSFPTLSTNPSIEFGQVVKRKVLNKLAYINAIESSDTANDIYGIAVIDVQSQNIINTELGKPSIIYSYLPGRNVTVVTSGFVCVPVQNGTPAIGGKVYVRIAPSSDNANLPIGGIETEAIQDETVEYVGAKFESGPYFPTNGVTVTPGSTVATSQCATIYIRP